MCILSLKYMKKQLLKFYVATFLFTWTCWITSLALLEFAGLQLITQEGFITSKFDDYKSTLHILALLLFAAGVYGPMFGAAIAKGKNDKLLPLTGRISKTIVVFIVVFVLSISLFPGLVYSLVENSEYSLAFPLVTLVPYFLYQLATSGLEEIGWRGFALPKLMQNNNALESGWKLGWLWAIWHFPFVIYLYLDLGISLLIPALIGFTFNIIGMSIIYSFLYVNTKSLPLMIIFHALTNTASIYLLGATDNPVVGLAPAAVVWLSVFVLKYKYGDELILQKNSVK